MINTKMITPDKIGTTNRTELGQFGSIWYFNKYPNCTTVRSEFGEKPENSFRYLSILEDQISIIAKRMRYMEMRSTRCLLMLTRAVSSHQKTATVINILAAGELRTGRKLGSMILTE